MIPKFRAWMPSLQWMCEVTAILFDEKSIDVYKTDDTGRVTEMNVRQNEAVLMQSTGIKDTNGVEIFEGDVVTKSSNSWQENNLVKVVDFYNKITKDEVGTLTSSGGGSTVRAGSFGVTDGYRIRKLTPRECWRLQGFPDWAFDKAQEVNSNSQLYKQAGNSVTVSVIAAIAKELEILIE